MERVSSISASRRRGGGAEIVLGSGERLVVSTARLAGFGLARDDLVEDGVVAALRTAARLDGLEQRLLRLVAIRARSRSELDRRMERWQVSADERQELLDRLTAAGLLDDRAFAHQLSASLRRRGHGSSRAAHDLDRLGVDDATASPALADHAQADGEIAAAILERRFGPPPYDAATLHRAAGLLARRGFEEDVIRSLPFLDD
ncbi:MAG: regulatory protein [Gaiellales bacterium]|nr:regulatory protein [Gaiellales bacterium]